MAHWNRLAALSLFIAAVFGGCTYDYKVNIFSIPDGTTKLEVIEWLRIKTRSGDITENIKESPKIFTYDASNTDISLFTKGDSFSFLVNSATPQESSDKRFTLELSVAALNSSSNITSYGSLTNQLNGTSSSIESLDIFLPPKDSIIDGSGKTSGPVLLNASVSKSLNQNQDQMKRCSVLININGWRFDSDAKVSIDFGEPSKPALFELRDIDVSYRSATNIQIVLPQGPGADLNLQLGLPLYLVVSNPRNTSTDPKTSGSARLLIAGPKVNVPLDLSCTKVAHGSAQQAGPHGPDSGSRPQA